MGSGLLPGRPRCRCVEPGLRRVDATQPDGGSRADLASSWSFSSNGLALTFTIKPGLTFSDGTPLDANR